MTVWDRLRGSRSAEGVANQIARGEIAHAWLLVGPAGSGKGPTASALAAALNCRTAPLVGCGECSSCLRILRRRHPDVHHIVPEGPIIAVDVVREGVIPEANRSPFEAQYQVFIIEEAERMNPAAQNALLKTLEEPQPRTVFVLISDRAEELLETVHSRCRVVRLEPVPEERIVQLLQQEGASAEVALLAARVSEGNLDRARALAFDHEAGERRRRWVHLPRRLSSANDALDSVTEILDESRAAAKALQAAHKEEIKEMAETLGERRGTAQARNALEKRHKREVRRAESEVLADALITLASFYRDVLAIRRGGEEAVANLDLLDELRGWTDSDVSDAALVEAIERCIVARGTLTKNANPQLAIEAVLVELARLAPPQARIPSF
ncbi:MAG: DNA polymerase III subunit delta' [Actinobacteria bacterium]|nr:DNA polymerase III subunit delta' [Actinomycetota bacterium]